MDFDEIADKQGWSIRTMLFVVRDFISVTGLSAMLDEYAQSVADEENTSD